MKNNDLKFYYLDNSDYFWGIKKESFPKTTYWMIFGIDGYYSYVSPFYSKRQALNRIKHWINVNNALQNEDD